MKREPLISVVVPVYKVESYLPACIESLINQTYKNLEIILVDDGSPDRCGEICEEYAKKDARITVLHKVNGGLSDARNHGIDHAHGDLISFLDSDDLLDTGCFEKMLFEMEAKDCDIAECYYVPFEDGTDAVVDYNPAATVRTPFEWLTERDTDGFETGVVWAKMYQKSFFDDVRFPVGKIHEDEATTYKLIYKANRIVRMRATLYLYRQRAGSIMSTGRNLKSIQDTVDAFRGKVAFFAEHGEEELTALFRAKLALQMILFFKRRKELTGEWKDWYKEIRKLSGAVMGKSIVPVKYKVFFTTFLVCPPLVSKIKIGGNA